MQTRQSEMADLARRATSVCTKFHRDRLRNDGNCEKWDLSQFHMGGPNFDTGRSWKL